MFQSLLGISTQGALKALTFVTALASVVAMPDLLKQATQAQALAANPTPLIVAAVIYVAFLWPLVAAVSRMERRFAARRR